MRKIPAKDFGRRMTQALEEKGGSIKGLADHIGKKYEMARRYVNGLSIPREPETLEQIADYLGKTVGWLMADEDTAPNTPFLRASELKAPIKDTTIMEIGDDAMLTVVEGMRLLGTGDQVILSPIRARNADIVAIPGKKGATLRRLMETDAGDVLVAADRTIPDSKDEPILGVVTEFRARTRRM